MEYGQNQICAIPGQLWKNIRTGDTLFVFRNDGQIEGVFSDGRKRKITELINLSGTGGGWVCVYSPIEADRQVVSDRCD